MKIFGRVFFYWVGILLFVSCSVSNELVVSYSNPQIHYSGRIDSSKIEAAELYWSGTSIKINFQGEAIKALLEDNNGDNYYNIIIDNDSLYVLRPDTIKHYYSLASELSEGKHTIEIFKRTEWDRGRTAFYGFQITGKSAKLLPAPPEKQKKIEFYGNSITAGYGVEDLNGNDRSDSIFTNNYLSYSSILARHYNAECNCICRSGIGITISWFPIIMPDIYDRINPEDSTSKWDFSLYQPDIVVVNLFQNDSWLVEKPERAEFKSNFGVTPPTDDFIINAYRAFISSLREHYPDSKIICALGNMDATEDNQWTNYIEKAVADLNDSDIYTHFIPYKGTEGHPSIEEQKDLANSLIHFIDEQVEW